MVSAWPEALSVILAEWPVEPTAGARIKRNGTGVRSTTIGRHPDVGGVATPPFEASIASLSSFLSDKLLLGKLSETVVVVGNAPHDHAGFLVGHLIGNRASFLCTKAPMCRAQGELSDWHS